MEENDSSQQSGGRARVIIVTNHGCEGKVGVVFAMSSVMASIAAGATISAVAMNRSKIEDHQWDDGNREALALETIRNGVTPGKGEPLCYASILDIPTPISLNYSCDPGFYCPNTTASVLWSLPQVCPPTINCTALRLRGEYCEPQGPFEP